jgi:hypothetical protein
MYAQHPLSELFCKIVELETGISRKLFINSVSRKREVVVARCIYANLLTLYTNMTPESISTAINKHRTLFYYMQKLHDDLMCTDKHYATMFRNCVDKYVEIVSRDKTIKLDSSYIQQQITKIELDLKNLKELMFLNINNYTDDKCLTD